jgi:putative transposase
MPFYRLFYHFVWATRDRLPLITPANRDPIYAAMIAKVDEQRGIVHAINGMPDHVHLVATVPPRIAVAHFIGQIKGASSHLASHLHGHGASTPFAWQAEYGVITVSEYHLPVVVRYVERQQQHHAENKLNLTLEGYDPIQ